MKNWKETTIPILLHGDAAPVFQVGKAASQSFDVYSVQSCWLVETVMVAQLYLFGLFSHQATEGGWTTIWQMMVWSLFWLSRGVWPKVNHAEVQASAEIAARLDMGGNDVRQRRLAAMKRVATRRGPYTEEA